jgi:hypothetical protein
MKFEQQGFPMSRRAVAVVCAIMLIWLAVGIQVSNGKPDAAKLEPPAHSTEAGCRQAPLRYFVSDDPADTQRQAAFERSGRMIPAPGVYLHAPDRDATLHAISHGDVVIFFTGARPSEELAAFARLADTEHAGVLVVARPDADRADAPALEARRNGARLTCSGAGPAQVTAVQRFAAAMWPRLNGP